MILSWEGEIGEKLTDILSSETAMPDHNSTPSVIDDDVELRNSLGQQRSPVRVITLRSRLYEFHERTWPLLKDSEDERNP